MKKTWISIVALAISVVAFCFSICRVVPVEIGTDTYIGTLATLIGICVTLVIGYQIFNVIEWRGQLRELKTLKRELTATKEELNNLQYDLKGEIHNATGFIMLHAKEYSMAVYDFLGSLFNFLNNKDYENIDTALCNLELVMDFAEADYGDGRIELSNDDDDYFITYLTEDGKEPAVASMEIFEKITSEFSDCPVFKSCRGRLEKIKDRFEKYTEAHNQNKDK